jgi:hypothetical protein
LGVKTADAQRPARCRRRLATCLQESRWLALSAPSHCFFRWPCGVQQGRSGLVACCRHRQAAQPDRPRRCLDCRSAALSVRIFGLVVDRPARPMSSGGGSANCIRLGNLDRVPCYIALAGFALLLVASSALEALRFHTLKVELPLAPGGMLGMEASRLLAISLAIPARPCSCWRRWQPAGAFSPGCPGCGHLSVSAPGWKQSLASSTVCCRCLARPAHRPRSRAAA